MTWPNDHRVWLDDYRINASHANGAFKGVRDCIVEIDGVANNNTTTTKTKPYSVNTVPIEPILSILPTKGFCDGLYYSVATTHTRASSIGDINVTYEFWLVYDGVTDTRVGAPAASFQSFTFSVISAAAANIAALVATHDGGMKICQAKSNGAVWSTYVYEDTLTPGLYTDVLTDGAVWSDHLFERTSGSGIDADGVPLKDGTVDGLDASMVRSAFRENSSNTYDFDVSNDWVSVNKTENAGNAGFSLHANIETGAYVSVAATASVNMGAPDTMGTG